MIAYYYNLDIMQITNRFEYYTYYYHKPYYTRIAPYALGLFCRFILFTHKKYKETSRIHDRHALNIVKSQERAYIRIITFVLGLSLINFLIFSQYNTSHNYKYDKTSSY